MTLNLICQTWMAHPVSLQVKKLTWEISLETAIQICPSILMMSLAMLLMQLKMLSSRQ